jgi:2-polyprenyl-3-methyl-5-hydroxy-6-metoxy-1,4-benzoquinol methylase
VQLPADLRASLYCEHCHRCIQYQDGIFVIDDNAVYEDFPKNAYRRLFQAEDQHFWFAGRNEVILTALRRQQLLRSGDRVLDIGCGTGFVLRALEQAGLIGCGIDMHISGLRYARQRVSGPLICESATRIPFQSVFDIALLCDVIEHTTHDSEVIRQASQAVKPGGMVLITVPANPSFWTELDIVSGHKRRYTAQSLQKALIQGGLKPIIVRHFNILLSPLQMAQRLYTLRLSLTEQHDKDMLLERAIQVPTPWMNRLCRLLMSADIPLMRCAVPFGASLIALGKRL